MAPRWLSPRQAAWGHASSNKQFPIRTVVIVGLVALMLGGSIGLALGGGSPSQQQQEQTQGTVLDPATKVNPVISQDVAVLNQADQSPDGAVKAVTGFLSGMANVAVRPQSEQTRALDNAVSRAAPPATRQALTDMFTSLRTSLQVQDGVTRRQSAIVTSPASYRVTPISQTRADVTVWYVNVFVDAGTQTASSYWATATTQMEWSDHWRFLGFKNDLGPTPQIYSQDARYSTFADVAKVFSEFKAFRYAIAP